MTAICLAVLMMNIIKPASIIGVESEEVNKLVSLGVMRGTGNGLELERQATRLEGLVILLRLMGKESEASTYESKHMPFEDVPEWGTNYVQYAYDLGITKGVSPTNFGSNDSLDARSYTTMVLRTLQYDDDNGDFSWAGALDKGQELGIVDSNQVKKEAVFTREDMAFVSARALTATMKLSHQTLEDTLLGSADIDDDPTPASSPSSSSNRVHSMPSSKPIEEPVATTPEPVTEPEPTTLPVEKPAPEPEPDPVVEEPVEPPVEQPTESPQPSQPAVDHSNGHSILASGAVNDAGIRGGSVYGTDATAAFQYAVDNYTTIIIPQGNYRIDGTVSVTKPVTIISQGGVIYSSPISGKKVGIFNVKSGGSGSVFDGLEVRSIDQYTVFMPNDTPSSKSSNRIFVDGRDATDVTITDCSTYNLMYSVQGFGMDRLVVEDSKFVENYINIWMGDATGVRIRDTYFSTSPTADVYAHCMYIGYDIYDIQIKNIVLEQTSEDGGALLNFAWLGGDPNAYHIHDVLVDGVTIKPSETINAVIQSYGVENAVFRNIKGTILANSQAKARNSIYKGGKSNGDIRFEDCDVTFECLNTIARSANSYVTEDESILFINCNFVIEAMNAPFIQTYAKNITFQDSTLTFGQETFNKTYGLVGRGVNVTFKNTDVKWTSDYFMLSSNPNTISGYEQSIVMESCTLEGSKENAAYFILNNVEDINLVFTKNTGYNLVQEGTDVSKINALVHDKFLAGIDYTYTGNTYYW